MNDYEIALALIAPWPVIGYLWWRQRKMVTSYRKGNTTLLKDAKGQITYTKINIDEN